MLLQAFVRQIFIQQLCCVKRPSGAGRAAMDKSGRIPALGELTFQQGNGDPTLRGGVGGCLELKEEGPAA